MTKKTYTVTMTETKDGITLHRRNDGFSPYELLGVLEQTQLDIIAQIEGKIKPDVLKREVVR